MPKPNRKFGHGREREKSEFDQQILDIARVTRVTEGGKHLSFRVLIVIGDRHGRVGYGVAKGADVQIGVDKATRQARKRLITVPIYRETIPHFVLSKFKAATVMLKPAPVGSGIIAGGAVRSVLELAGVPNVSSKILGKTKNKIVVVKATFEALKKFKRSAVEKANTAKAPKQVLSAVEQKPAPTPARKPVAKPVKKEKAEAKKE